MSENKQHLVFPILDLQRLNVVSTLGRGAKGVVFLVKNEESNESFALKVILRDLIGNEFNDSNDSHYRRIFFEQQALMSFKHPLLPRLKGVLSTDKVVGYAIDYCPGHDLHSLRKQQTESTFSENLIRFYAAEIVLTLEYLHSLGIVYRDLKPENIMIQEDGHIMLVDFDLSTKLTPKAPRSSSPTTTAPMNPESATRKQRRRRGSSLFQGWCNSGIIPEDTALMMEPESEVKTETDSGGRSNSFVGTEEYVAPEMLLGKGHDFAVDWWSLGILLYEMLYGFTPFKGDNRKETFSRILTKPAQLVGEPTALRDLISKLLEKDPTKRIGVEQVKAHQFFKGVDWNLLLTISRPPYIPSRHLDGRQGIKQIDVESVVQKLFQTSGGGGGGEETGENKEDDEKNKCYGEKNVHKGVWVSGLNNNTCETHDVIGF